MLGAGWLDFAVHVEEANTDSPRVLVRVAVPWWWWWTVDVDELEARVWRCLASFAAPSGRWVEYRVRVARA